jgi:hypothetical protein
MEIKVTASDKDGGDQKRKPKFWWESLLEMATYTVKNVSGIEY